MKPALLLALSLCAIPTQARTTDVAVAGEEWFFEQITQTSVDSSAFITGGQAGHPDVTVLRFATKELCEIALTKIGFLNSGVDFPMGTGSYFARVGSVFTVCLRAR